MLPVYTTQLSSVDANAGNQVSFAQTVNLPSSTSPLAPGTSLPGDGTVNPGLTTAPPATPSWATWLIIAALAWFALSTGGK